MNEQEREKIEFLIHGFLDGELTQRQRTELKRLAHHDPSVKKQLHSLYRQKELLSAMPVEKAPKELLEVVRTRLERRMILGTETTEDSKPVGQAHLLFRRIAAVAAMLLLPLGILGIILFQIMKPAKDSLMTSTPIAKVDSSGEMASLERNPAGDNLRQAEPILLGRLTLTTDQPIAVTEAIKKAILSHDLLSAASAERTGDTLLYRIQCGQEQMLSLAGDFTPIWPLCSQQQLVLSPDETSSGGTIVIGKIRPEQLCALIRENNPVRLRMIASSMERLNTLEPADSLRNLRTDHPAGSGTPENPGLPPVQPRIAWNEKDTESAKAPDSFAKGKTEETVSVLLELEVKSITGDK